MGHSWGALVRSTFTVISHVHGWRSAVTRLIYHLITMAWQVVATAQEQWNCSAINGVPLEDVPLGQNAHWEARIMGKQVEKC